MFGRGYNPAMKKALPFLLALSALSASIQAQAPNQPIFRDLDALNWMDFDRLVPEKISTVLLPVGTLEAHGVVNNGADNTVPAAMARDLAPRVDALVAPTISYGITTSLSAFPGSFRISPEVFKAYSKVLAKVEDLIKTAVRKWDLAGL